MSTSPEPVDHAHPKPLPASDESKPVEDQPQEVKSAQQASFLRQFSALQIKNLKQKARTPCASCCELFLPVLFILGIVGAWAAVDNTTKPSQMFVNEDSLIDQSGATARTFLCNNGTTSLTGILACPATMNATNSICAPAAVLPVDGLCLINKTQSSAWIYDHVFNYRNAREIPSLDDMIAMRWAGRVLIGDYETNPATYLLPDNALAFGSFLYFADDGTGKIHDLINYWNTTAPLFRHVYGGTFNNTDLTIQHLMTEANYGKVWSMIHWNTLDTTTLDITFRFNRTHIPWTGNAQRDYWDSGLGTEYHRNYWAVGFPTLQVAAHDYYVKGFHNQSSNVAQKMNMAVMPLAAYRDALFLSVAGALCPLVLTLAYLYSVSQLVKRMVEEKEKRLREGMMIMGLHKAGFYSSWLVTYTSQMLISSFVITVVLKLTILEQTDPTVVFLLFLLFSFSTVTLASFMSSLFSKSRTAAVIAPLLFFATSIPTFATDPSRRTRGSLLGLSWLPANAFGVGTLTVFRYEQTRGFGWGDAWSESDDMRVAEVMIFLAADIILYFILGVYLDAVLPTEWGTSRHPLFCLMFWKKDEVHENDEIRPLSEMVLSHSKLREDMTSHDDKPTVQLRNLVKEFEVDGSTRAAVKGTSLDMYPNEVTVLLGHNGAGKTTTINLLTGMLPVTKGNCTVYGKSILTDMPAVRQEIGFCPQHNILWDDLTVREHLEFYASIKGMSSAEAAASAEKYIEETDLGNFADVYAGTLSGGNKRKLSIAIAFVGESRLIFLDEPTAGMDVKARRHTWSLIRRMTAGRTIVLTTHFMDEADLLGNHIAIMNHGEICCSGTPMYLKSKLGVGYSLNIAVDTNADPHAIFEVVQQHVPEAELLSAKGGELSCRLPMSAVGLFPELLEHLEEKGSDLGARSFGISITTLEEVFLRISDTAGSTGDSSNVSTPKEEEEEGQPVEQQVADTAVVDVSGGNNQQEANGENLNTSSSDRLWPEGCNPVCEISPPAQFKSLLWKRFHNSKRDRRTQCFQIFTPLLCILFAMWLGRWEVEQTPAMDMDPKYFKESFTNVPADTCGNMYLDGKWVPETVSPRQDTIYNFSQWLLTTHDYHAYLRDVGFHCNGSQGTTLFVNSSSWHALPVGTQLYTQAMTRQQFNNSAMKVNFVHHLLPFTPREDAFIDSFISIIVGFFILIPFTFIPSTFVSYVVKEKETRAKHLQLVSGVNYVSYWMANFLFDIVSFFMTELMMLILMALFNREEYVGGWEEFGAVLLLFLFYGMSGVAASYLLSFGFNSHGTASNVVMLINFIAGFLVVMLMYILSILESTKDAAKVLKYFCRLMPAYCLGEGIINLATLPVLKLIGEARAPFDMDVTGWPILYMALELPLFLIATIVLDHPSRELRRQQLFHNPDEKAPDVEDEDVDVAEERRQVEAGERNDDLVSVQHIRKVYSTGKVAVKNLSFGVKQGEIFAFLGTNGAGKTTTMSILTGEHLPTTGHGYIAGFDAVRDRAEARKRIGFCPQFDALCELLTPKEHFELYAALRGIDPATTAVIVPHLLDICDLEMYKTIPAHQLSGGNKRKLSLGIALIGQPKVLFLDEPSAGMDPKSRRKLWSVIQRASKECSVVLTTHHLEEIEVLGDRVAIMVAGELRCIGSLQHLKGKFGSGFEMMIKVKNKTDLPALHEFVAENIPTAQLTEEKQERATYGLPKEGTKLSSVFRILGEQQEALQITDYSLSQTSLELVFLRISEEAAEKEHEEEHHAGTTA